MPNLTATGIATVSRKHPIDIVKTDKGGFINFVMEVASTSSPATIIEYKAFFWASSKDLERFKQGLIPGSRWYVRNGEWVVNKGFNDQGKPFEFHKWKVDPYNMHGVPLEERK